MIGYYGLGRQCQRLSVEIDQRGMFDKAGRRVSLMPFDQLRPEPTDSAGSLEREDDIVEDQPVGRGRRDTTHLGFESDRVEAGVTALRAARGVRTRRNSAINNN